MKTKQVTPDPWIIPPGGGVFCLIVDYRTSHCRGGSYVKRNIGNTWGRDMGYSLRMWRLMSLPSTASTEAMM